MVCIIYLKAGHPTGKMQRDGVVVERNAPVITHSITKKMQAEQWFEIKKNASDKDVEKALAIGAVDLRPVKKNVADDIKDKKTAK